MPNLLDLSGERQTINVQFDEWLPDHPAFNNPGFPNCENAIPADLGFYRPMRFPFKISTNSLKDVVAGVTQVISEVYGIRDVNSNAVFYYVAAADPVADTVHLFQYTESTDTFSDVTPAVAPPFSFNDHCYFDTFGNKVYAAFSINTPILTKEIGTAAVFAEVTDAPEARDIVVTRGFLMAINYKQGTSPFSTISTGVTWSAASDPENWIDPIANPSGALSVLRGETTLQGGGRLQRCVPGINGSDVIIFGQRKIWRVRFIGPPAVWEFQVVSHAEGTPNPPSVISDGQFIYFIGRRGWMRFDGSSITPIGAGKVNRAFIDDDVLGGKFRIDGSTLGGFNNGIRGAVSAEPFTDRMAFWTYRAESESTFNNLATDTGDTLVTDTGDNIQATIKSDFNDTMLIFNEVTGRWGNAKLGLQALGRVETNRTALDDPRLVGIDNDLDVVAFGEGVLASFFETAEAIAPADNRVTVRHCTPYIDAQNCTISLLARERLNNAQVQSTPLLQEEDASVPVNESGLFVSLRMDIPAFDTWTANLGMSVELADWGHGGVG